MVAAKCLGNVRALSRVAAAWYHRPDEVYFVAQDGHRQ